MNSGGVQCRSLEEAGGLVGTSQMQSLGNCAHLESLVALCCPRITGTRRPLTFDGEGFAHRQQFAVGVNGDLVVQKRFVHDEGVEFWRVTPAGLGDGVSSCLGLEGPPQRLASRHSLT